MILSESAVFAATLSRFILFLEDLHKQSNKSVMPAALTVPNLGTFF